MKAIRADVESDSDRRGTFGRTPLRVYAYG